MKKALLTTATIFSLIGVTVAMAGGLATQAQKASSRGGIYVGIDFGLADLRDFTGGGTAGVHVGYLAQVAQHFFVGGEIGYQYLPGFESTEYYTYNEIVRHGLSVKYNEYAFNLLAVGKYYLTDQLNLFGKAGIVYVNRGIDINYLDNNVPSGTLSGEGVKPQVALGLGYNITSHLEVTVQYSHIFADKMDTGHYLGDLNIDASEAEKVPSTNVYLLGANYYF